MNKQIDYYGVVILLRALRASGIFSGCEIEKIARRVAVDNGTELIIFL